MSEQTWTPADEQAKRVMTEVVRGFSEVRAGKDGETRSPGSVFQVLRSRRRLKALSPADPELVERLALLHAVLDTAWARHAALALPFYLVTALGLALSTFVLVAAFAHDPFAHELPPLDPADWVLRQPATLRSWCAEGTKEEPTVLPIPVPKGTAVAPISNSGDWVQVKLADGQIGWLHEDDFAGSLRTEIRENTTLHRGARWDADRKEQEPVAAGTKGTVLRFGKQPYGRIEMPLCRVKLDDGREGWVTRFQCRTLFTVPLPGFGAGYRRILTFEQFAARTTGRTRDEVVKDLGPESSAWRLPDGRWRSYHHFLISVRPDGHRQGLFLQYDAAGKVESLTEQGKVRTRFYEKLPGLAALRGLDPARVFSGQHYSKGDAVERSAWQLLAKERWWARVLEFLRGLVVMLGGLAVVASWPRLLAAPLLSGLVAIRAFSNDTVKWLGEVVLAVVFYAFFLVLVLTLDSLFNPLVLLAPAFSFWAWRLTKTITYHRCPHCRAVYTALDAGARYAGQVEMHTWDKWERHTGTTVHETATERITTHHYESRDRETITTYDKYLDQRTCARCGEAWEVERFETSGSEVIHH